MNNLDVLGLNANDVIIITEAASVVQKIALTAIVARADNST